MISYDKFLQIFMESRDVIVFEEELEKFYNSIIPSLIFFYAGKNKEEKLMQLEEECQWPILKKIGDWKLDIYRDADPVLLNMFINSIKDEGEIRSKEKISKKFSHGEKWILLRLLIQARIEIYEKIFGLTKNDIKMAQEEAKKIKRSKLAKIIGTGAIVAGMIGATYILFKNKIDEK